MNPKAVGEASEGAVLGVLVSKGKVVLTPFGNNQRYDFVVDDQGNFIRVQVKTGRLRSGCVVFYSRSTNGFTGEKRNYKGDADEFAVYCPETGGVYMISVDDCGDYSTSLRVETSVKTDSRTKWARDYLVGTVA